MESQTTATCNTEDTNETALGEETFDHCHEAPPTGVDIEEAKSALEALKPILMSMNQEDIRHLKVGATTAVSIGLAYAGAYEEDRPLFEETFTPQAFEVESYDNLAERAKAFWQADIHMRQELNTEGPLRTLSAEAKPLRSKLLRAANYLWGDDQDLYYVVKAINKGVGYANHADDLGSLATLFYDHWDQANGNCDVTLEDIDRAKQLGAEILRFTSPSHKRELGKVKRLRHQAAEYLRQGIEDVRAAAGYLFRNNEKMLERYPSLFVRKRRKSDKVKVSSEVNADVPVTVAGIAQATTEPSPESLPPVGDNIGAIPQLG